jgi:hypothetical protein
MGGLFEFLVGTTTSAIPPAWQGFPSSFSFAFGVASSQAFAQYATSPNSLTFSTSGSVAYPAGLTISSGALRYNGSTAISTYAGLTILATDNVGLSTRSPAYSAIIALGAHAPVWSGTTFISIQAGNSFNLNTICSDQDPGDAITFTPLIVLPTGISLNQVTGLITVAQSVAVNPYNVQFRATDRTNRVADSVVLTLSVTAPAIAPITWATIPSTVTIARGGTLPLGANAASAFGYTLSFGMINGNLSGTGVSFDTFGNFTASSTANIATITNLQAVATDGHGNSAQSNIFSLAVQNASAIQNVNFPIGFTFYEGVSSSVYIGQYFNGNPSLLQINKLIADDQTLTGITYNQASGTLTYDGTTGIGAAGNYQIGASDGTDPILEQSLPYKVTKPFQGALISHPDPNFPISAVTGPIAHGANDIAPAIGGGNVTVTVMEAMGPNNIPIYNFANVGGDWWDNSNPYTRQGGTPFYTLTVPQPAPADHVTQDITNLVQVWQTGAIQNYGIYLKQRSNGASCVLAVNGYVLNSVASYALLNLTFTDNTTAQVTASVCAQLTGTSTAPSSNGPTRISGNMIIFFDLTSQTKRIKQAVAQFSVTSNFGPSGIFDFYAARWEQQVAGTPPAYGVAQNYPGDVNLETDPSIIMVERFPDLGFVSRGAWSKEGSSWVNPLQVNGENLQRIVGDTDPQNPGYAPLKPGIPAIKLMIAPGISGGKRAGWRFFANFGSGPSISSSYVTTKSCFARWYMMLANDFDFGPPFYGGHHSGLEGTEAAGNTGFAGAPNPPLPFVNQATGRYVANPIFSPTFLDPVHPSKTLYEDTWFTAVTNYQGISNGIYDDSTSPLATNGYGAVWNSYRYDHNNGTSWPGGLTQCIYGWDLGARAIFKKNRWYCIEQFIQCNAAPYAGDVIGTSNGIQRIWIDGRLAFERTNCYLVTKPEGGISDWMLQFYYGGPGSAGDASNVQKSSYIAALAIGNSYIGPMIK